MMFGLQIGVFGFTDRIVRKNKSPAMDIMFNRLQPGLTQIKRYFQKFIDNRVTYATTANYQAPLKFAISLAGDIADHEPSRNGMYVKCFVHVSPRNNTSKSITNGCRTHADMSDMSSYIWFSLIYHIAWLG